MLGVVPILSAAFKDEAMSEHQYYEFQTVDRLLTEKEQAEVRKISTRAEITASSFTNEYQWGSFKGDALKMMEKWYDAHLYWANWGDFRLMLRMPLAGVDIEAMKPYAPGAVLSFKPTKTHLILDLLNGEDVWEPDWNDESESGMSLGGYLSLRQALLDGDYRLLYLGWLAGALERGDDDAVEPPVPAGLGSMNAALWHVAERLGLSDDLIEAAAEASEKFGDSKPLPKPTAWLRTLDVAEKDAALARWIAGDSTALMQMKHQFRKVHSPSAKPSAAGRTLGELLAVASRYEEIRLEKVRREAEIRRVKEQQQEAAAKAARFAEVAADTGRVWKEVGAAIALRNAKGYDRAAALMLELRDVCESIGESGAFRERLEEVRYANAKRYTFIQCLQKSGLIGQEAASV
jgi:hypothetical protein